MRRRSFLARTAAGVTGPSILASGARAHAGPLREAPPRDRAEPHRYSPLGSLPLAGATEAVVGGDGETVHVATTDGFAVVDVSDPTDPSLLAERRDVLAEREGGPLGGIQDVAVDGERLLVVGPAHHPDELNAAVLYDASEPTDPTRLAVHETDHAIHNAFLDGDYAYLTDDGGETSHVAIVDLTAPAEVARWSIVDHDEAWTDVPRALRTVHDVWVGSDVAVLAYWDVGTVLLDVSDPAAPSFLARVGDRSATDLADAPASDANVLPGNHHYSRLDETGELLAIGTEAWSEDPAEAPGGIELWDVSSTDEPSRLAEIAPPPTDDPSRDGTWTTAHNFDLRDERLYSSWYDGGVKVHDVSDPSDPVELAWWHDPDEARFWTAQRASACVVGSDMGTDSSGASIYTFAADPGRGTATAPRTSTTTATGSPGTEMPVTTMSTPPGSTPTSPPDASSRTPTGTGTSPTATDGQPGFTLPAALAALGLGGLLDRLRR